MAAFKKNFLIEQGTLFQKGLTIKTPDIKGPPLIPGTPINITGWIIRGQIRAFQSSDTVVASFQTEILDQTTKPGEAIFYLLPAATSAIPIPVTTRLPKRDAEYIYDLEIEKPDGDIFRLLEGTITVSAEITR